MIQLLDKDCSTRLGCGDCGFEDVKAHPFFQTINWAHLLAGHMDPPFKPNVLLHNIILCYYKVLIGQSCICQRCTRH